MPSGSSILDILLNNRLANGEHEIIANNVNLGMAEVKNFYGAQTFSATPTTSVPTTFFNDVTGNQDNNMCIRIFHGDLTISAGITFTPPYRTKGMFVLVKGNLTMQNGSSISMTARGSTAGGDNVYLWGTDYVRASGALGGNGAATATSTGTAVYAAGTNGDTANVARRTGGGGSGGATTNISGGQVTSGKGGQGTSYSGGAGSGGVSGSGNFTYTAPDVTGATGSNAYVRTLSSASRGATGGTGVVPGQGRRIISSTGTPTAEYSAYNGNTGAGGLLMVACLNQISFVTAATISSNGTAGAYPSDSPTYPFGTGGASGGGSVNVLYRTGTLPTLQVNGGAATATTSNIINGGAGGAGTTTTETFSGAGISYPRRWLVNSGGTLYYWNFGTSSWVAASGSGIDPYVQYGMLDADINALTKTEYQTVTGFNPSSLELKAYMA